MAHDPQASGPELSDGQDLRIRISNGTDYKYNNNDNDIKSIMGQVQAQGDVE